MNLFRTNTTAFDEEDFLLMTDLTEEQIIKTIEPVVLAEREGGEEYDNDMLVDALRKAYPFYKIFQFNEDTIEIISI